MIFDFAKNARGLPRKFEFLPHDLATLFDNWMNFFAIARRKSGDITETVLLAPFFDFRSIKTGIAAIDYLHVPEVPTELAHQRAQDGNDVVHRRHGRRHQMRVKHVLATSYANRRPAVIVTIPTKMPLLLISVQRRNPVR